MVSIQKIFFGKKKRKKMQFRTILFPCILYVTEKRTYRKVASSNTSHLEAHAGFFRLLMKGIFDPYVL